MIEVGIFDIGTLTSMEFKELPGPQYEPVRAQRRVGHLLGQRDRADDDDRRPVAGIEQRVERGDPQTDQVRRRRQV